MEFIRQGYCCGMPCPVSLVLQAESLPIEPSEKP